SGVGAVVSRAGAVPLDARGGAAVRRRLSPGHLRDDGPGSVRSVHAGAVPAAAAVGLVAATARAGQDGGGPTTTRATGRDSPAAGSSLVSGHQTCLRFALTRAKRKRLPCFPPFRARYYFSGNTAPATTPHTLRRRSPVTERTPPSAPLHCG